MVKYLLACVHILKIKITKYFNSLPNKLIILKGYKLEEDFFTKKLS